jgi:hypothetical protein
MTHLIVKCEADMEHGVDFATNLALEKGDSRTLEITFPSEALCDVFMHNLFKSFYINKVPNDTKMSVMLNVPLIEGDKE